MSNASEYQRRAQLPLLPLRYNYSSPSLQYLDRARLFPEDLAQADPRDPPLSGHYWINCPCLACKNSMGD